MATLAANLLTMTDLLKRVDQTGKVPTIIEMLTQSNEVLQDMTWIPSNLPTGHLTTVRTGLPAVFWRLINQGVPTSKSTTAQITEACAMLEAWSEIDVELARLAENLGDFLLSESQPFIESMNQTMAHTLFYGNSAINPEQFTGLAPRYSSLSATNGQNIINAGGSDTDLMSIWLVNWGPNTVTGIYAKNSEAGLSHKDFGEVTVETTAAIAGNRMQAYRSMWAWKCGIALRDWRYVVRIANIDRSILVANSSPANLIQLMTKACYRIINPGMGRPVFYMNRTCAEFLDIQRFSAVQTGGQLSYDVVDGKRVMTFRGIPIRIVDALLETETTVS